MFADDTNLYSQISKVADCENLQDDLNKLEIWLKKLAVKVQRHQMYSTKNKTTYQLCIHSKRRYITSSR